MSDADLKDLSTIITLAGMACISRNNRTLHAQVLDELAAEITKWGVDLTKARAQLIAKIRAQRNALAAEFGGPDA